MFFCEMHLHTKGNSCCALVKPADIAALYKSRGYDGIVCTNHFNADIYANWFRFGTKTHKLKKYLKGFYDLVAEGSKLGLSVYFGIELATSGDEYGSKTPPWAEQLIYGITPEEFLHYNTQLFTSDYATLFALAEKNGWLIVQAHPNRDTTKLLDPRFLHGAEAFNGHPGHIERNDKNLAFAEENSLIKTAGSDFHFVGAEASGMLFMDSPRDEKDLVRMLKDGTCKLVCKMGTMPASLQ